MLGHTKISTTLDIYSHVSLDLERKAAARLNAVLRG
jgi:integrase